MIYNQVQVDKCPQGLGNIEVWRVWLPNFLVWNMIF